MSDPTDTAGKAVVKALTDWTDALDAITVALRNDEISVEVAKERSAEAEADASRALAAAVAPLVTPLKGAATGVPGQPQSA